MQAAVPIRYVASPRSKAPPGRARARKRLNADPAPFPPDLSPPINTLIQPTRIVYEYATSNAVTFAGSEGGPVADGARLELLFWGPWDDPNPFSVSDVAQAVANILASPYLTELSQYGVNSITMGSATIVLSPGPPGSSFSGTDAADMVWSLIDDGHFPQPPDPGSNIVYMIFARGTSGKGSEAEGAHQEGIDNDYLEDLGDLITLPLTGSFPLAWIAWVNPQATLDATTAVFTHELVETLTDPEPN